MGERGIEEFLKLSREAYVFSVSRERIKHLKIPVNYVDAGEMGKIQQRVEIYGFVKEKEKIEEFYEMPDGECCVNMVSVVDFEEYFTEVTEGGGGYLDVGSIVEEVEEKGVPVNGIMIITKTASSYIGDRKEYGVTSEKYYFCNKELGELLAYWPAIEGMMAAERVKVGTKEELGEYLRGKLEEGKVTKRTFERIMGKLEER